MLVDIQSKANLWHRRQCHIGHSYLLKLKSYLPEEINLECEKQMHCDICLKGKQCRQPFPRSQQKF